MTTHPTSLNVTLPKGLTLNWGKPFCKVSDCVTGNYPVDAINCDVQVIVEVNDGFLETDHPEHLASILHYLVGHQSNGEVGFLPTDGTVYRVLLGHEYYRLGYNESPDEHEVGWFFMR